MKVAFSQLILAKQARWRRRLRSQWSNWNSPFSWKFLKWTNKLSQHWAKESLFFFFPAKFLLLLLFSLSFHIRITPSRTFWICLFLIPQIGSKVEMSSPPPPYVWRRWRKCFCQILKLQCGVAHWGFCNTEWRRARVSGEHLWRNQSTVHLFLQSWGKNVFSLLRWRGKNMTECKAFASGLISSRFRDGVTLLFLA